MPQTKPIVSIENVVVSATVEQPKDCWICESKHSEDQLFKCPCECHIPPKVVFKKGIHSFHFYVTPEEEN